MSDKIMTHPETALKGFTSELHDILDDLHTATSIRGHEREDWDRRAAALRAGRRRLHELLCNIQRLRGLETRALSSVSMAHSEDEITSGDQE